VAQPGGANDGQSPTPATINLPRGVHDILHRRMTMELDDDRTVAALAINETLTALITVFVDRRSLRNWPSLGRQAINRLVGLLPDGHLGD
jgi:hypothetical protein